MDFTIPIYCKTRNFIDVKDLVVTLNTKRCSFDCSFCGLKSRSSVNKVSLDDLKNQIDYVFNKYKDENQKIEQISLGNEGSILDENSFGKDAWWHMFSYIKKMHSLKILSLETRPEFITDEKIYFIKENLPELKLDFTIGIETQDDEIRNNILNKNLSKTVFESKLKLLAKNDIRLTAYVMIKPSPFMTEKDGVDESVKSIMYLDKITKQIGVELILYLNPTYIAKGTLLGNTMIQCNYKPPQLKSIKEVILAVRKLNYPVYIGLWSEGLENDNLISNKSDKNIHYKLLKRFNYSQDYNLLSPKS